MSPRTRFAPSPTGFLHVGSLRTAVYAYALAKHSQGQFILRIEDTDQKREVKGATQKILDLLPQFGLNWDELHVQSQRVSSGIYQKAATQLLSSGHAFYCQCEARNAKVQGYSQVLRDPCRDKHLSSGAIKLKIPDNQTVSFYDFVLQKEINWNTNTISDTILLKSDNFPTYHLAVVVDDHDMKVTHIIRAVEWLASTPIMVLTYKYLNLPMPQLGHPTAILDPSGGKLSKRKGNVSCEDFISAGYLPEALLNFIILLGWAPKDNRELFSLADFVNEFDITGFQRSNPTFNTQKLDWFNSHYIRELPLSDIAARLSHLYPHFPVSQIEAILPLVRDRLITLKDFASQSHFFLSPPQTLDTSLFTSNAIVILSSLIKTISALANDQFNVETLNSLFKNEIATLGVKTGDYYMNLRIAICASRQTPPITESIVVLGQQETLSRLHFSQKLLSTA